MNAIPRTSRQLDNYIQKDILVQDRPSLITTGYNMWHIFNTDRLQHVAHTTHETCRVLIFFCYTPWRSFASLANILPAQHFLHLNS
ncbi:unnamed protein product, partial [Nezara viridula]